MTPLSVGSAVFTVETQIPRVSGDITADDAVSTALASVNVRRHLRERDRLARAGGALEASVELSRHEVGLAPARYKRGLSNNLDFVAAEGRLVAAEGRRIAALAHAAVRQLRLLAAMDVLAPEETGTRAPLDTRGWPA